MSMNRTKIIGTVGIASGAAVSSVGGIPPAAGPGVTMAGVIDMQPGGIPLDWGAILVPSAWTAADICFTISATGQSGTFVPMRDSSGTLLVITGIATAAAGMYHIPSLVFAGGSYMKLLSITAAGGDPTSTVNQAAARTLYFIGG